jgi:Tol biopolymer transport system component/predicted Ser/Thr protein kinase
MLMSEMKGQNSKLPEDKGAEPTRSFDGSTPGPGSQIGPFRIEQELGRGGAGVVYLAHDTKLDRPVAIKSLPAELMENPKARTRFSREARVLASLNHPNIASIYEELQETESHGYLILEYVPGRTLAERIASTKLKLQEALSIAQQITEAVAAAHEHDVIHRDLKPSNIKITPEGKVKVLDFGLAKALGGEAQDQQSTVTEPGRIIGTPAYMSPEQARGQETDKRCDIWSFGCVLYEMLTGKVPFEGETVSDTLANVLQTEPEWELLPKGTPANIKVLLRRCLEKDPRCRLQHMGDAVIEINETLVGTLEAFALPGEVAPVSRLFQRDVILACFVCLLIGVLISGIVIMSLVRPSTPEPRAISRMSIPIPEDNPLFIGGNPQCFLAISADGTRLVYVGRLADRTTQLYMRSIDSLQVKPIPGTVGAHNPFFSPDGKWVGFFTENQLKKISLAGGEPLPLLKDIPWGVTSFGSWADDGTIVLSVNGGAGGFQRIADDGGQPEMLISPTPEEKSSLYSYPQALPGNNAILYSHASYNKENLRSSRIEAFLTESGKRQTVLDNASYATYVRSGHLIFLRDNVLMVAPFDVKQLKITGPSIPFVDDVGFSWRGSTPQIAISNNGTFVYILGSELRKRELVWIDRNGQSETLDAPASVFESPRLSPDGQQVAVVVRSQKEFTPQVYIYNILHGTLIHFTTEGQNNKPQWSPDGTRIAFKSRRSEGVGVYWKTVGKNAPAELLTTEPSPGDLLPYSWLHNRNLLACTVLDPITQDDIWILDMEGDYKPKPFLNTGYDEYNPTFSPDGHWLAYVSDESGRLEIYVQEYVDGGRKERISTDGGINPAWSHDGRELYYINGKNMMVVKVTSEPNFDFGTPEPLFESSDEMLSGGNLGRHYDVSDDGRFLMVKTSDDAKVQLICVHNWFEELKRLAPLRNN